MNKIALNLLLALLTITLFSCDKVDEVTETDFNVSLIKTLPIVGSSTNEMTSTIVLDATADPEILKHADKIKNYEITELLFAIENYQADSEDEIYFDGSIGFSKTSENQPSSSCSISDLPITNWAGTGNFPISTCDDLINGISTILKSDNAVKIYMIGTYSKAPLTFDLKVTVKVKITANVI